VQYREVEPGVSAEPHHHDQEQATLILQLEAEFTIEAKSNREGGDVLVYEVI
jgi:uncharacterized cupin superfamily protein